MLRVWNMYVFDVSKQLILQNGYTTAIHVAIRSMLQISPIFLSLISPDWWHSP